MLEDEKVSKMKMYDTYNLSRQLENEATTELKNAAQLVARFLTYPGLTRGYQPIFCSNNCINFALYILEELIKRDIGKDQDCFKELYKQREVIGVGTKLVKKLNTIGLAKSYLHPQINPPLH